jgi:hypothetical protein
MIAFDVAPDDSHDALAASSPPEHRETGRRSLAFQPHWSFCQPSPPAPAASVDRDWLQFLGVDARETSAEVGDPWVAFLR